MMVIETMLRIVISLLNFTHQFYQSSYFLGTEIYVAMKKQLLNKDLIPGLHDDNDDGGGDDDDDDDDDNDDDDNDDDDDDDDGDYCGSK